MAGDRRRDTRVHREPGRSDVSSRISAPLEHECPRHDRCSARRRPPAQNEMPRSLDARTWKPSLAPGTAGKRLPTATVWSAGTTRSELGSAAVVDEIVAIPSALCGSHLHQPWPHAVRRALNRDRVCERGDWIANELVSGAAHVSSRRLAQSRGRDRCASVAHSLRQSTTTAHTITSELTRQRPPDRPRPVTPSHS